jgi:hypothetical protein
MAPRLIYLSCAPDDWDATSELRQALQAASTKVVARRPDLIELAWRFIACFSVGGDRNVRYDREEVLAAIDVSRAVADRQWFSAVKLQQCHLPALPINWSHTVVLEPVVSWAAAVEQILCAPAGADSTASVNARSMMFGGDINVTAVEGFAEGSAAGPAHLTLTTQELVADGDGHFTARRLPAHGRKRH